MTKKEAIGILMLSPIYFRLTLLERMELVNEFVVLHSPRWVT